MAVFPPCSLIALLLASILLPWGGQAAESGEDTNRVTRSFLIEHRFKPSDSDSNIFALANVRLKDAAADLGFSTADLRKTPSQPPHSDVQIVKLRDLYLVVTSEVRDEDGNIVSGSLGNPDAVCTVSVGLRQVSPEREVRTGKGSYLNRPNRPPSEDTR